MARSADQDLKCPSAQPGMADVQVLGVVMRDAEEARLAYLDDTLEATPDLLATAAPAAVSQVFRLSARCEEQKCTHFDGSRCQLAVRIATLLPEVVDHLPACNIRPECRWFRQEGRGRLRSLPADRHRHLRCRRAPATGCRRAAAHRCGPTAPGGRSSGALGTDVAHTVATQSISTSNGPCQPETNTKLRAGGSAAK